MLTEPQILALAPDPASAKAGQGLSARGKWVSVAQHEQAVWGECQGSGSFPYQTQIDLAEPAFKCSCPSKKFPCKHAIGLFLLLSRTDSFPDTPPPPWVVAWNAARAQRAATRVEKATAANDPAKAKPEDPAAAAKKAAARDSGVASGMAELALWLRDVVRQGLAATRTKPYKFWDTPAARLVDAKAPGAARLLRNAGSLAASGRPDSEVLTALARLYLLTQAFERRDTLPADTLSDVRAAIGFNLGQDEILSDAESDAVADLWLVLGQTTEEEDRLRVRRTWLWGEASRRGALLLQFAHGSAPFEGLYTPGTRFPGTLVFFPAGVPLRAIVRSRDDSAGPIDSVAGYADLDAALATYSGAVSHNPWLARWPLPVAGIVPYFSPDGQAQAADRSGRAVPLSADADAVWRLIAISGGAPIDLFGTWDGAALEPLAAGAAGRWLSI